MIASSRQGNGFFLTLAVGAAAAAFLTADHGRTPFDVEFEAAAKKWGIPSDLLRALARVESSFDADAVSPANANGTHDYGLMQINERTAASFAVAKERLLDPVVSIDTACRVLDDARKVLGKKISAFTWAMAYNVGPDLQPAAAGAAYAQRVVWHWSLYNLAGLFRSPTA